MWQVAIADGATCMSDIAVLADQERILGSVASMSTLWRTLNDIDGVIDIRIDPTLVNSYSDKDYVAGNFKGGYGFHPLTAWCDNTGEALAILARPGNAGSNTAADHLAIIDAATAAIPAEHRHRLLITIDGANSSHKVIEHLTTLNASDGCTVEYSVGNGRRPKRQRARHPRYEETFWWPPETR